MTKQKRTALVTGANGFVGSHVCEHLARSGAYRVKALVRKSSSTKNLAGIAAEITHGEISDRASFDAAIADVDLVVHVAGVVRERTKGEFMRINRDATRNVAEACAERPGSKPVLVHVSSQAAAGPAVTLERPRSETEEPAPVSEYGRSKLAGELEVRKVASKVECSIVRPPTVYGPRDADFYDVFKMAVRGLVLKPGFTNKVYSIIHAEDLAEAVMLVAEKGKRLRDDDPAAGLYFATDGGNWSWEEIARLTGEAVAKKPRVLPLPASATYVAATFMELGALFTGKPPILNFDKVNEILPGTWICSSDALARDTGFAPRLPLAEGLKQTARWYREHGMLP